MKMMHESAKLIQYIQYYDETTPVMQVFFSSSSLVFIQFRERVEFWFHEKTVSKRQFNRFICVVMSQSQQFYAPTELISNAST